MSNLCCWGYGIPVKEIRNIEFLKGVLEDIDHEKELLNYDECKDILKVASGINFVDYIAESLQNKYPEINFVSWPKNKGNDNLFLEIEGQDRQESKEKYDEVMAYLGMDNRIYASLFYQC